MRKNTLEVSPGFIGSGGVTTLDDTKWHHMQDGSDVFGGDKSWQCLSPVGFPFCSDLSL